MFQLFAYNKSTYNVIQLMKKKVHAPQAYEDYILEHGTPNKVMTNTAKDLIGSKFCGINW